MLEESIVKRVFKLLLVFHLREHLHTAAVVDGAAGIAGLCPVSLSVVTTAVMMLPTALYWHRVRRRSANNKILNIN